MGTHDAPIELHEAFARRLGVPLLVELAAKQVATAEDRLEWVDAKQGEGAFTPEQAEMMRERQRRRRDTFGAKLLPAAPARPHATVARPRRTPAARPAARRPSCRRTSSRTSSRSSSGGSDDGPREPSSHDVGRRAAA